MATSTTKPAFKNICVYCGSSPGTDDRYVAEATQLGGLIANADMGLIYGGGDRGLMGAVARGVLAGGGKVTGIIPTFLIKREQEHGADELAGADMIEVPDMHTRKRMMFDRADAFVALPGGIGTLEELVEILTWSQLGQHDKPMVLLNSGGFWTPYSELMDHMEGAGFLHSPHRARPLMSDTVEGIIPALQAA
ncbi:TIGR00730 family Rossman fold protein [Ahrensia sp. R2A130]|uniref:LOG family protein n=1 Tax=Ahrensia sp. R2A130 TaxID=744979 RepID=UPI0001E09C2B|nr:TIGR00730 family Rossman fold protein [Ahrensia sp. R2A130]EFL90634.1 lysine decarboxylase [Ahrensia sp. R2A130]